ncbi:hypothetical protein A1Q1_06389 [Trichosporon asahii var. asahii CBS 2479]|uniref:Uncharacterized protein n=1 Tax=Trichosporon asahii var. asahii (strain ATCC 90039 / CBS 2479 / JCM 2466 / KCTC 7840 / NBRC 103889/ NCYC 2677 / UAMH 7654) TaxID=1186058 RepID=J5SEF4_TRIAS|nr:hypothetical protein A1Q1_06389 [Trichosporon asahii var. asahii CBS 2479]EJT45251.1 hypothetical protein A1Q1_06389 [Trichosporon asahii var. asahii CBS 2479]
MSFACTHIDLAVQAACCDRLGDIFTDAKGASFCGTSSHEEFLSCAGVESKCNVVVEKRQAAASATSAIGAGASAVKSGAAQVSSAIKSGASNAASHAASATKAIGGSASHSASGSHAASGSHSASAGAKSSAAAKKKSAGERTVPSLAAALVLAVAAAAIVA